MYAPVLDKDDRVEHARYDPQLYLAYEPLDRVKRRVGVDHADHPDAGKPQVGKDGKVLDAPDLVEYGIVGAHEKQYVRRVLKAAVQLCVLGNAGVDLQVARRLERLYDAAARVVKVGQARRERALAGSRGPRYEYALGLFRKARHELFRDAVLLKGHPDNGVDDRNLVGLGKRGLRHGYAVVAVLHDNGAGPRDLDVDSLGPGCLEYLRGDLPQTAPCERGTVADIV